MDLGASARWATCTSWPSAAIGPLLATGVVAALGHRIVTAGVIGANIGGGVVLILGVPVALFLFAVGLIRALYLLWRARR